MAAKKATNGESVTPIWTGNNRACKVLFSVLKQVEQIPIDEVFKDTGKRELQSLAYCVIGGSKELMKTRSTALAFQLDTCFRVRGADFEDEVSQEQAVEGMRDVLMRGTLTVAHLAGAADAGYRFFHEMPS